MGILTILYYIFGSNHPDWFYALVILDIVGVIFVLFICILLYIAEELDKKLGEMLNNENLTN